MTTLIDPKDYSLINAIKMAFIIKAITEGEGTMTLDQFCQAFGKQKGHVKKKLENNFSGEQLSKMETHFITYGGNNKDVAQTVTTYRLDKYTVTALAMSYDLMLGVEVSKFLEAALSTLASVDKAAQAGDLESVTDAVREFREKSLERLQYNETDSETQTHRTAYRVLNRRSEAPRANVNGD